MPSRLPWDGSDSDRLHFAAVWRSPGASGEYGRADACPLDCCAEDPSSFIRKDITRERGVPALEGHGPVFEISEQPCLPSLLAST